MSSFPGGNYAARRSNPSSARPASRVAVDAADSSTPLADGSASQGSSAAGEEGFEEPPAVLLATAGYDHTIRFWDVVAGGCIGALQHNESHVNCLAVTRDKMLLAAGGNPAIRLYDTTTAVRTMPDGSVSASNEPPLHILEPTVQSSSGAGNVMTMAFSRDGDWLWSISEDGAIRIWDVSGPECFLKRELLTKTRITAGALYMSAGGRVVVFIGDQNGRIKAWDLAKGKMLCETCISDESQATAASPTTLASPSSPSSSSSSSSSKSAVHFISVAPSGRLLAAVDHSGKLHLWSITDGMSPRLDPPTTTTTNEEDYTDDEDPASFESPPHEGPSIALASLAVAQAHITYGIKCAFSPDSQRVLTTSADGTAKLWRVPDVDSLQATPSIELVQVYSGHSKWVWDGAFSADGAYIVTAASDNTARLWDAASGETIAVYSGHAKALTSVTLNDLPSS